MKVDDASWGEITVRTAIVLVAAALAVSGCAAAPVQIALLALDGVSFVVSKKSIADHGISIVMQQDCALWRGVAEGRVCYPDGAATMIAETEDTRDQAVADARIRSAQSTPAAVDPVTAWARSELAYRKSAAGDARPSSADAGPEKVSIPGPYPTIEPEAAPQPDAPSAPAMRVRIEFPESPRSRPWKQRLSAKG